jgi:hypothetical protein
VHAQNDAALREASDWGRTETFKMLREWIEREKAAPPPVLSLPMPMPPPRPIPNMRLPDPV